jgi:beta-N-acetylhexosaminidase
MKKTDLRTQIGQLLIMGFDGAEVSARLDGLLGELRPGGVILFARNLNTPAQVSGLLTTCQQRCEIPLFRCVDLEGGTVDRLRTLIAHAPSAQAVTRTRKRELWQRHGKLIGEEVRALGFNVDFAPVFDLERDISRAVMGSRVASTDPREVVSYARAFLKGLRGARVLGCGKHFPGLGEGSLDSHDQLPVIEKPWRRVWEEDLFPYRALRREVPFVMVAHAAFPAVTGDRLPASLSRKWMTDILRQKLGYRGLIISDDLEMGGVLTAGSIEDVARETIRAGADIFLVCRNEDHVERAYAAVLREAERDARFARRVRESAARVLAFKKKHARILALGRKRPDDRAVARLRTVMEKFRAQVEGAGAVL